MARQLVGTVIQCFGGYRRFAETFEQAIADARKAGKHATVCRAMWGMFNLMAMVDMMVADLTDEQLLATVQSVVKDLIKTHPEIVLHAAQNLGWRVIPPGET